MDPFTISLLLGGVIGLFSEYSVRNEEERLAREKGEELEKQREELERTYNAKKKEDLEAAALNDKMLTRQEGSLSYGANQAIEALGLQQEANAISVQNQQISNSIETGSALANAATSGIRTGSVMSAIENSDAYAAGLLEANREALNNQTETAIKNTQLGLMQNLDSLTGNRYQNNAVRNSYDKGGYNYERFMQQYNPMSRNIDELMNYRSKRNMWDAFGSIFTGGATAINAYSSFKSYFDSL